jgi:hypothetical protein
MTVSGNSSYRRLRVALLVSFIVVASPFRVASALAAAPTILQIEASTSLPGFNRGDLLRYLAQQMTETQLGEWRFEPAPNNGPAPDRIEWVFGLNPYAGGDVRSFARAGTTERVFGVYRPITIEARLYLNGEYQILVEKQAVIQGGPRDPDLAAAVASVTENLLGPRGAFHAIESSPRPAYGPR